MKADDGGDMRQPVAGFKDSLAGDGHGLILLARGPGRLHGRPSQHRDNARQPGSSCDRQPGRSRNQRFEGVRKGDIELSLHLEHNGLSDV